MHGQRIELHRGFVGCQIQAELQPRDAAPAGSDEVWLAVDVGDGPVTRLLTADRDSSLTVRRGWDAATGVGELTLRSLRALAR